MTEKNMRAFWDARTQRVGELRAEGKTFSEIGRLTNLSTQGAKQAHKRWVKDQAKLEMAECR